MRSASRSGRAWVNLIVAVAIVAVAIAYIVPAVQRARNRANLLLCADRLRQIGVGLADYKKDNAGALPLAATVDGPHADVLNCLRASHALLDEHCYYCPAEKRPQFEFSDDNFESGRIGYYWYAAAGVTSDTTLSRFLRTGVEWPRPLNAGMDPRSWVMSDLWNSGVPTAHTGFRKGINFLMLDGSVSFIGESARQSFH